jgi:hypothetical protein
MQEPKSFEDQIKDLYRFFKSAEINNEEITYDQIRERLVTRSYDTLVWYANNFWTWFLSKKKEKRGRYRVFVCHDLDGYPEEFFVAAHNSRQGKYFYHFGKALDASRKRAELRKQAKEQAGQQSAELSVPPTEAEQEFPEELHFADNETEEEGDEISESIAHTEPVSPREEPAPLAAMGEPSFEASVTVIPPNPMTTRERTFDMLDFSRKNREALEQVHLAVETLTLTLTQEREQLRRELISALEAVKQTLEAQTQQLSLLPAGVSQLRADVVGQMQGVKLAITQEQERFHREVTDKVGGLVEEIHQSQTPPDFSPILAALTNQMRQVEDSLTEVIKQSPTPPDLASIREALQSSSEHLQEALLSALQQAYTFPELPQMATTLTHIQQQMEHLAQPPSVSSNGQIRALQASIRDAAGKARDVLDTLNRECMAWLDELERHVQTTQRGHEETNKYLQTIQAYISPVEEETSPNGEEQHNGTVANEAQEHE